MSNGEVTTVGIPSLFGLTGTKTAFQDEGILLGNAQAVNFVGDGVAATLAAGVLTVQIDGGAAAELVTTLGAVTETDTTHGVAASVVFELGTQFGEALTPLAPKSSPTFTGTPTAPTADSDNNTDQLATTAFANSAASIGRDAAKSYADSLVTSVYKFQSTYNPQITGEFPTAANTVGGLPILKCFTWVISGLTGQYTFQGVTVDNGDTLLSLIDDASATTSNDWHVTEKNLGYTAENSTNKSTDNTLGGITPSDIAYPSQKAVKDYSDNKFAKIADQRYQFVGEAGTTYTVPASAVTTNGNTIIELSSSSLNSITVDTNTAIGKTAGDSVYVSITGAYASQILVANGVTLQGDLTFSYQHQTKCLIYKGSNTWKVVG